MADVKKQKSISQIFTEGLYSFIPSIVISFILLTLFNFNTLYRAIPKIFKLSNGVSSPSFRKIFQNTLDQTGKIPHINTIGTFMFWFMAGILVFLIFLFVSSIVLTARNDADMINKYRLPIYLRKSQLAEKITVRWIFFVCLTIMGLIVFFFICLYWLPLSNSLFISGFLKPRDLISWANTLVAILILGTFLKLNIFLFKLGRRLYGSL